MAGSRHDREEKVHRLMDRFLDSKQPLSMNDMRECLGCSRQTVERVLADFRKKHKCPIEKFRDGPLHLYCLKVNENGPFHLPGLWLRKEELIALFAINGMIREIPDGVLSAKFSELWKSVESHCGEMNLDWNSLSGKVKILPIGGREVDSGHFRNIVDALMKDQRLLINYQSLGTRQDVERLVSPLRILRYRDNWYLDAFCHKRNELRSFAMSRINRTLKKSETAIVVDQAEQDRFFSESYGIFTGSADKLAIIHFTGLAALEVSKEVWHPKQIQAWLNSDVYELRIPFHKCDELIMDLLKWGELVNVLSPQELRIAMKDKIARMHTNYQD